MFPLPAQVNLGWLRLHWQEGKNKTPSQYPISIEQEDKYIGQELSYIGQKPKYIGPGCLYNPSNSNTDKIGGF